MNAIPDTIEGMPVVKMKVAVWPQRTASFNEYGKVVAVQIVKPEELDPSYVGNMKGVQGNAVAIAEADGGQYSQHEYFRTTGDVPAAIQWHKGMQALDVKPGEFVVFKLQRTAKHDDGRSTVKVSCYNYR